ncbi:MAG TPA: cupin-like domain-containing protein [Candidatus Polarisedimenticolaceae bacterium]|nr:cupin-like domain-containing protein [Candidatus Polarisedimenticolaceae bacterium]
MACFRNIKAFADVRELTSALKSDVTLFGPRQFRGTIRPDQAFEFMNQGFTLYMVGVERDVPETKAALRSLADDLGIPEWAISVEAFAAVKGSISSFHYDHDVNFQILLHGMKRWWLAPNQHIRNPIFPYHPRRASDGGVTGFVEEAFARDPLVPTCRLEQMCEMTAEEGTSLFLPRGHWHETEAMDRCFGVNIVLKGTKWYDGIARALSLRLQALEEFRAYAHGVMNADPDIGGTPRAEFDSLKVRAAEVLRELTPAEIVLAGQSFTMRWTARAQDRSIRTGGDSWYLIMPLVTEEPIELDEHTGPFLAALTRLNSAFRWEHALRLAGGMDVVGVRNALEELVGLGALEYLSTRSG